MADPELPESAPLRPKPGMAVHFAARLLALVLIGCLLVWLRGILIPVVLALLLTFLLLPLVNALTRRRVPGSVAIVTALIAGMLPVSVLVVFFSATVGPVSQALPKYQARFVAQSTAFVDAALAKVAEGEQIDRLRREIAQDMLPRALNEGARVAQSSLGAATTALGSFLLMLLLCGFMLAEAQRFREKVAEAYGPHNPLLAALEGIGHDLRAYLIAKTLISALTGLCVWAVLAALGVDFAAFWGLLAFPLNFVPTVGAIAASLPPVIVALVDPAAGPWTIAGVVIGLGAVNGLIGAILDPRYVGHAVKVSPLVVFLSMLVWGFLWGPIGMILAVPIMVSVKVICARIPALEPIATLMKG